MTNLSVFFYGVLGASSLGIGALVGVFSQPSKTIAATIMAFGSGTLISAIAFEITWNVYQKSDFWLLVSGFLLGGFIFISLSQYVDEHGGFLRQQASSRRYLLEHNPQKISKQGSILETIAEMEAIRNIPENEKQFLANHLRLTSVEPQTIICEEGDLGDFFYLIVSGEAEVTRYG